MATKKSKSSTPPQTETADPASKSTKTGSRGSETIAEARKKADRIEAALRKGFGASISQKGNVSIGNVFPTGMIQLDIALGPGGLGRGRIYEVFGQESAGKTTFCLYLVRQAQRLGMVTTYVDAEHSLNPVYAEQLGVSWGDILLAQPDSAEQALEIVDTSVELGSDLVVVDSVAAMTPLAELNGEMGDTHIGLQARLMSQAMRKLTSKISKTDAIVVFINQTRLKIGTQWGSPETTPGGNALKFYASARLRVAKVKGAGTKGSRKYNMKIVTVKNKLGPPYREVQIPYLDFDTQGPGIDLDGQWVEAAVDAGIIDKSGSWYSYGGERLGQGLQNVSDTLREEPELFEKIQDEVRSSVLGDLR